MYFLLLLDLVGMKPKMSGTQLSSSAFWDHLCLSGIYKGIVLSKIKVSDFVSAWLKQMLQTNILWNLCVHRKLFKETNPLYAMLFTQASLFCCVLFHSTLQTTFPLMEHLPFSQQLNVFEQHWLVSPYDSKFLSAGSLPAPLLPAHLSFAGFCSLLPGRNHWFTSCLSDHSSNFTKTLGVLILCPSPFYVSPELNGRFLCIPANRKIE